MHLHSYNIILKNIYPVCFSLLFFANLVIGSAQQGYIGAQVGDASSLSPDLKGACIFDVVENSPAQIAGLKKGDIIQSVNGRSVLSASDLTDVIKSIPPGSKIPFSFLRSDKSKTCVLTISIRPLDPVLIDTIPNFISMIGNKCISAKKVPGDIFKQPLTFGSYAVFERKGNNYELKQKWDDEDAEPGRVHEGVVMAAKFPYIRTIMDPEYEGNLDMGLAENYRKGKNLEYYSMIGKNNDNESYALYAKRFNTPDGKKEFLVTGLLLYSDYITVVLDKWQKKDNLKLLSYSSEDFRKLSGQILAAKNSDLLSFYVLEGIVKQPETALKRKVWLESDEASKLKQRFEQDKARLFSTRYILLITTPSREFLNNPLLKWNFNNQYDLNAESFKFSFDGDLSLGVLDLESAFPVKWDIPKDKQLTDDGRKEMDKDLAQIFKEIGLASKQVENEIEYYDAETKIDARQYVYTSMTLGAYDQIRRIKSKYRQPRSGILEIKVPAKEAEKIDGNKNLHIALIFDVSSETMVDPYSGDSLYKCTNGEIRILDRKSLGHLFVISFKQ